jgi:hypothetical protein
MATTCNICAQEFASVKSLQTHERVRPVRCQRIVDRRAAVASTTYVNDSAGDSASVARTTEVNANVDDSVSVASAITSEPKTHLERIADMLVNEFPPEIEYLISDLTRQLYPIADSAMSATDKETYFVMLCKTFPQHLLLDFSRFVSDRNTRIAMVKEERNIETYKRIMFLNMPKVEADMFDSVLLMTVEQMEHQRNVAMTYLQFLEERLLMASVEPYGIRKFVEAQLIERATEYQASLK